MLNSREREDAAAGGAHKGVVLVSGGSRGLGARTVESLLAAGYAVACCSRRATPQVEAWCARPDFYWQSVDAADYRALSGFVAAAERRLGRIVGLVNNAAVGGDGILSTMPVEAIDDVVAVNLTAPLYLTKLAVGKMLKERQGCVINVSSINALRGHAGVAAYSATKGALDAMTRSLAKELGPKGIRVNSVAPGYFESDMVGGLSDATIEKIRRRTPLGRLGTTAEIARLIVFLIDEGTFISGQTIAIDGGFTC
jgi:3-oxoacyl-[acyl-carrier protein] reductase